MLQSTILIVCDEPATSRIWGLLLTELHCFAMITNTSEQAIAKLDELLPDLIVIDATSRDFSGVATCQLLREHVSVPMLLFTPINNESHTLEAYAAGADEVAIKPISPALFLAKVKVWLGRTHTVQIESLDSLRIGGFTLDPSKRQLISDDGRQIPLSSLEFRMLFLLMNHPNQPFTSDEIVERVWEFYGEGNTNLVKNLIYRLRKKIEPDPNRARFIRTETGGYLFRR